MLRPPASVDASSGEGRSASLLLTPCLLVFSNQFTECLIAVNQGWRSLALKFGFQLVVTCLVSSGRKNIRERGATITEYAILVALLSSFCAATIIFLGDELQWKFFQIERYLRQSGSSAGGAEGEG